MAFTAPFEKESQLGYLRVRFLTKRFRSFDPNYVIISLFFLLSLMMNFNFLTMFCSSAIFADKRQAAPRLSLTNVTALNYLLRSEIFVSEDSRSLDLGLRAHLRDISRNRPRHKSKCPAAGSD